MAPNWVAGGNAKKSTGPHERLFRIGGTSELAVFSGVAGAMTPRAGPKSNLEADSIYVPGADKGWSGCGLHAFSCFSFVEEVRDWGHVLSRAVGVEMTLPAEHFACNAGLSASHHSF